MVLELIATVSDLIISLQQVTHENKLHQVDLVPKCFFFLKKMRGTSKISNIQGRVVIEWFFGT